MSYFDIILILVLILAGYYVFLIGKEIMRKTNAETEKTKSTDEQEIDITEDLVHFDVTEIDPADIMVEDTVINTTAQNSSKGKAAEKSENSSIPVLPFPMDVQQFHELIKRYDPDKPNPELDEIVFAVSTKPDH